MKLAEAFAKKTYGPKKIGNITQEDVTASWNKFKLALEERCIHGAWEVWQDMREGGPDNFDNLDYYDNFPAFLSVWGDAEVLETFLNFANSPVAKEIAKSIEQRTRSHVE